MPKISAKFRKRYGIPYAIEQFAGRQFRCRHCNEIFLSEKELDRHIKLLLKSVDNAKYRVSQFCPKLNSNMDVRFLYSYDVGDRMKRQWLKMKKGDEYDGIQ